MSNLEQSWSLYSESKTYALRNKLLEDSAAYTKFVVDRLRMYIGSYVTQEKLYEWGINVLVQAIDTYSLSYGIGFESFMKARIRESIRGNILSMFPKEAMQQSHRRGEMFEKQLNLACLITKEVEIMEVTGVSVIDLDVKFQYALLTEWVESNTQSKVDKAEVLKQFSSLVDTLSDVERLVVTLFYYEELTLPEISYVSDLPEDTVLRMFARAVMKLKVQLGTYENLLF